MPDHIDPTSTTTVQITVLNLAPMRGRGSLLALADVEVLIDGVSIILHGVQVCATDQRTEVLLPKYRGADGTWMAAISLPDEVKGPMGEAVIAVGVEAGILRKKVKIPGNLDSEISRETC